MRMHISRRILAFSRITKRSIALLVDGAMCIFTVAFAYMLRLDHWVFPEALQWLSYAGALLLALPLFYAFGLYRAIFRYADGEGLATIFKACTVYFVLYAGIFSAIGFVGVPRTTGLIQPILLFLTVGASRAIVQRVLGGRVQLLQRAGHRRRVLIYGAGSAGRQLAAALRDSDDMHVVGFVDDDKTLQGRILNGKRIYGAENLARLITQLDVADLLLAIPSASRRRRNEILVSMRGTTATLRTLPGLLDLATGQVTVNDLRELDIEDLLGRDPVPPDRLLLAQNIAGKTVLVTGGGGSIGGELCRQVLQLRPEVLLLVEQSEYNLYAILQELEQRKAADVALNTVIVPILGSVQDELRMRAVLAKWRPDTIYHAAAYKHVPLVENNAVEGVRNNVFGTLMMAQLARAYGASDFVLISTDKAVRPTNVMGATKRLAEQILQALAAEGGDIKFTMVRFGNVLGSSGSVVPLFRNQIAHGGPITITHRDITRYFMTIPEAAQLVLQAGSMARGGDVFVLDMGEPVRIMDLACRMVELSGLTLRTAEHPEGDIELRIVGLRPGEKLYEELLIGDNPSPTSHPRIMKANEGFIPWPRLEPRLRQFAAELAACDDAALRATLKELVPEFQHSPMPLAAVETPGAPQHSSAAAQRRSAMAWPDAQELDPPICAA